jgi:diaminohydroxyphosphoribosylaminopyrimidine deaminase / 5-amino-6-(5-phosphoribosylamino)uracil reductase
MICEDEAWMRRALELAENGRGYVEPNPLVGAVVVRDGTMVGDGWHEKFGQAHAEVNALDRAGEAARGATLYVTLEPCCHHGKTPPCTDAVIRAGVRRVVAALEDPFPQVAGRGAAALRAAGIDIEFACCAAEARRQNAPYLKLLRAGRPYVHAKWAMTLDGKIASKTGDSKWISNEASRRRVHALRGRMDGILVGIGTVCADDPMLTARPPGPRCPCRIVVDSTARTPIESQLVRTASQTPTLVVVTTHDESRLGPLRKAGCEILNVPGDETGRPDLAVLLDELGRRRWTNLLVEGGAAVLGSFFDHDLVDEAHIYVAPKLLGAGKDAVCGQGHESILQSGRWITEVIENIDGDAYIRAIRG